jgi:pyrroloquinoline quinone (PQQ) biosynthesis protein C
MRKFADVYPAMRKRYEQYMAASKWCNVNPMTTELAKLWVQQLSIWTRTGFKVRGHAYANCPHPELRKKMLEVLGEEDVVDPRIGMNHRMLLCTSLGKATGQTLDDLKKVKPLPTTLVCFDILFGMADRTWEEGIAMASGHERMLRDGGYFRFERERLQRDLKWSDKEVAWLSGHDEADEDHGAIIELLDKYLETDDQWDLVEEAVVECSIAFWTMLDGVVSAYQQKIEPVNGRSCKGMSLIF